MCGIFGLVTIPDYKNKEQILKKCRISHKNIKHRGPDWDGEFITDDERVYLAHHRLSIIDPFGGSQPITSSDGQYTLCVNGEIYNYRQLRESLKHRFQEVELPDYEYQTQSDCEVIIPLDMYYSNLNISNNDKYTRMINELDGMFSFILTKRIENETHILIARDHVGITTLYYGYDDECNLYICSELKGFPENVTPIHFPPGHFMTTSTNNLTTDRMLSKYYTGLDIEPISVRQLNDDVEKSILDATISNYCVMLRNTMERAVQKRLRSDVPFGMLLSGGLDSSLVCSIATKLLKEQSVRDSAYNGANGLTTFSIGLPNSPDLAAAEKVAEFLGSKHYNFTFTLEEGLSAIRDVIYHLETYDVTTIRASTPMFLLSRKIKSMGIKMVLSGEGSDEIFGGYLYFLNSPNDIEHTDECIRRVGQLSLFDNLRANKSTMAWGLEARVPFLDKDVIDVGLNMPALLKRYKGIEKWILRKAFDVNTETDTLSNNTHRYLPHDLLWRQKEQFSDGVGYGWIDRLKDLATENVSDLQLSQAQYRFPHNTPVNKEEYYYRSLFEEIFKDYRNVEYTVQKWIPKTSWDGVGYDPSGRAQPTHVAKY